MNHHGRRNSEMAPREPPLPQHCSAYPLQSPLCCWLTYESDEIVTHLTTLPKTWSYWNEELLLLTLKSTVHAVERKSHGREQQASLGAECSPQLEPALVLHQQGTEFHQQWVNLESNSKPLLNLQPQAMLWFYPNEILRKGIQQSDHGNCYIKVLLF